MATNTDCCGTNCIIPNCGVCNADSEQNAKGCNAIINAHMEDFRNGCASAAKGCWAPVENGFKSCKTCIDARMEDCGNGCASCSRACWAHIENATCKGTTACASCTRGCWAQTRAVHPSTWIAIILFITTVVLAAGVSFLLFERFSAESDDIKCMKWIKTTNGSEIAQSLCVAPTTMYPPLDYDMVIGDNVYKGSPFGYRPTKSPATRG